MTNAKNNDKNAKQNVIVDQIYNVAKRAREMQINESQIKTLRAYFRANEKTLKYNEFRNVKFTSTSNAYKLCTDAINAFKNKNRVVTQ